MSRRKKITKTLKIYIEREQIESFYFIDFINFLRQAKFGDCSLGFIKNLTDREIYSILNTTSFLEREKINNETIYWVSK